MLYPLYPSLWDTLKISYIILVLIVTGIGFYFVSLPPPYSEVQTTIVSSSTTIIENIFVPSADSDHKLVMFTSSTPMWEYSVPAGHFLASPENGVVKVLAENRFLVVAGEWNFVYIIDAADNAEKINEGSVEAGQPIIQLNSGTFLFGAAKNCDPAGDIFLSCEFADPAEYFGVR